MRSSRSRPLSSKTASPAWTCLSLCRHLDLGYQPRRASPTRFQRLATFPSNPRLELANRALSAVTSLKFNIVQQVEKHAMLAGALSTYFAMSYLVS